VLLLNVKGNAVTFVKTDVQGKFSITSPEGKEVSKIAFINLCYARQNIEIWKFVKGELGITCKNLMGTNKREYRSLSVTGSSYSVTELRPREILASVTFNL